MASASRRTERPVAIAAGGSTGIDPVVSLDLGIDHGLAQVCSTLFRALDVPLVIGSGGLSHRPTCISAEDPEIAPEWRKFLIHGEPVPAWITGLGVASSIAPADRLAADVVGANRGSIL
jgi:hypothetical protein